MSSIFPNFALPNQSSYTNEWRVGSITRYWPPIHWCPVHAPSYVSQSTFTHLSQEPTNSFSHQTNNITVGPDSALALLNILPLDLTCFLLHLFQARPSLQFRSTGKSGHQLPSGPQCHCSLKDNSSSPLYSPYNTIPQCHTHASMLSSILTPFLIHQLHSAMVPRILTFHCHMSKTICRPTWIHGPVINTSPEPKPVRSLSYQPEVREHLHTFQRSISTIPKTH